MLRKIGAIAFYTICWLAYYQVVEIIRDPSPENQIKIAWSVFAGILFAYVMGFDFKFRWGKKASISQEPKPESE